MDATDLSNASFLMPEPEFVTEKPTASLAWFMGELHQRIDVTYYRNGRPFASRTAWRAVPTVDELPGPTPSQPSQERT